MLRHHMGVSSCVEQPTTFSPEFLLGRHLVLCGSRLIHVLICHIVILFQLLTHQRLHHELFHVLLIPIFDQTASFTTIFFECLAAVFFIHQLVLHEITHVLISVLQFRSCSSISIFVTTFPNFDPSRCP